MAVSVLQRRPSMKCARWMRPCPLSIPSLLLLALLSSASSHFIREASAQTISDLSALLAFRSSLTNDPNNATETWDPSLPNAPCSWNGVQCLPNGRVVKLDLSGKAIEGPFGTSLFGLSMLWSLKLGGNSLTGGIGRGIWRLGRLTNLELAENNLEGQLPVELGRLSKLKRIDLRSNSMSGQVPPMIFRLPVLQSLLLSHNNFTGSLPASAQVPNGRTRTYSASLTELRLEVNNFFGQIPAALGSLVNLQTLDLHFNRFTGIIPGSFGKLTAVTFMDLSSNRLTGAVPAQLGQMKSLRALSLYNNRLSDLGAPAGSFASGLADTLTLIDIASNEFSSGLEILSGLLKLELLYAGDNNFSGPIPEKFSNLEQLQMFDLGFNRLVGYIPPALMKLPLLTAAAFDGNALLGYIPPVDCQANPYFSFLTASRNILGGPFPSWLLNCSSLYGFDISDNTFSGPLPDDWSGLENVTRSVNISVNNFWGWIPESTAELKELTSLDASRNLLHGPLPSGFNASGKVCIFNVSHNGLQGPIPASLAGADVANFEGTELCGPPLPIPCPAPGRRRLLGLGGNGEVEEAGARRQSMGAVRRQKGMFGSEGRDAVRGGNGENGWRRELAGIGFKEGGAHRRAIFELGWRQKVRSLSESGESGTNNGFAPGRRPELLG